MNNNQLRKSKRESLQRLEIHRDSVIDFIAVWGPLLAPMVPAGLTAAAIIVTFPDLLHIAQWAAWLIAIITVVALEVLGIVSVETWLDMRRYNAENANADEKAPQGQAVAVVIIYAVVVLSLVFVLKIWHSAALYSLIPLTMLGLITSWTIVLRKQHNVRVWGAETDDAMVVENEALRNQIDEIGKLLEGNTEASKHLAERNADLENSLSLIRAELDKSNEASKALATVQSDLENAIIVSDELRTKIGQIQNESDKNKRRVAELEKLLDINLILSELTDKQRENLLEVIRLVSEHRVTGPSDLVELSDMGKSTVYTIWPVALASRSVYKNGDGAYHVRN